MNSVVAFVPLQQIDETEDVLRNLGVSRKNRRVSRQRGLVLTSTTSSFSCNVRTISYTPWVRKYSLPQCVVHSKSRVSTWVCRRTGSGSRVFVGGRNCRADGSFS